MAVLIVDDSIDQRMLIRRALETHGHEVFEAADGVEGLDKAARLSPSVILSDILMPRMDGFTFLKKAKGDGKLKEMPFILYSAVYTGTKEKDLALAIGAAAFVLLPKKPEEFYAEIEFVFDTLSIRKARTGRPLAIEEEEYLRDYSRIVAAKLEEKVRELEVTKAIIEDEEKRYRSLFNSIRDAVIATGLDNSILNANQPALRDAFGYEVDEVRGKSLRVLFYSDESYGSSEREISASLFSGRTRPLKADMKRKSGEIYSGEISAMRIKDDCGTPAGLLYFIRDVTERMLEERENLLLHRLLIALGVSPDFQSALVETMRHVCEMTDWRYAEAWVPSKDGTCLVCSKAFYVRAGYDAAFRRSAGAITTFRPGEGLPGRVWASRAPAWVRDVAEERLLVRAKEAGVKSLMAVPIPAEGTVVAIMVFFSDEVRESDERLMNSVSEVASQLGGLFQRKIAIDALKDSEERFRQITENINGAFWVTGASKDETLYISPVYETIWGRPCEELYKRPGTWMDAIHPDDRERVVGALSKQPSGEYDEVYRIVRSDASVRWIRERAFPIKNESGEVYRIAGIAEDITEQKKLQDHIAQAQKLDAIGEVTGGVAHDFNNILTAIMGFANLLQMKTPEHDPRRHDVEQIISAAKKAAILTQSLLAFSRQKASETEPIKISEAIRTITNLLARLIREDVELRLDIKDEALVVNADLVQFDQILINLATNARDAMGDGGLLTIGLEPIEMNSEFLRSSGFGRIGRYALITVSDTGTGMDEETKKKIFEPFFTSKEAGKGTGLGLSIVYSIVKRHNGFINVYSERGRGTTFKIYLPATDEPVKEQIEPAADRVRGGNETILLAEDNDDVRGLLKASLIEYGYRVVEAADGADAVARFLENKGTISLLIIDVIMPKKNGREAYAEIKGLAGDIKALFISGYTAGIIHADSLVEKGGGFISKPVLPTTLLKTVRAILDGKNG